MHSRSKSRPTRGSPWDTVRLGVLEALRDGPRTVSDLFEELRCSQSMVSQQVQIVECHGLTASHRDGARRICLLCNGNHADHEHLRPSRIGRRLASQW